MDFCKQIIYPVFQFVLIITCHTGVAQTTPETAGIITTLAGNGLAAPGFSGDGLQAFNSILNRPSGVALDPNGNVYFTDRNNNRIRKITKSNNTITTFAGTGAAGFGGDGGAAANARLNAPADICIDLGGDYIYFADSLNFRVRKISLTTGIISTVAGNGSQGYAGQTMPAINAGIGGVSGVEGLYASTLFISLGSGERICMLDLPTGTLSTFAGTGIAGFSGDGGQAINAAFNNPAGLSVDGDGVLYVADCYNHRIRKIDTSGKVTTVAGNGTAGFAGDEASALSASLNFPQSVDVDDSGNLFIADRSNHRIREVHKKTGKIYTVAGNGAPAFGGDGNFSHTSCTSLFNPNGVKADRAGNLYIADSYNNCIRKGQPAIWIFIGDQFSFTPTDTLYVCAGTSGGDVGYGWAYTVGNFNFWYVHFFVNGIPVPANGNILQTNLNDGDIIYAIATFSTNCNFIYIISDPVFVKKVPITDPDIVITASSTNICMPAAVTFTATVVHGGTNPRYQWQVNGQNVGTNSRIFTSNTLANGDRITCTLRSNVRCKTEPTVTSNSIDIIANPTVTPAVSISANATRFCIGQTAVFNAVATNSGNNTLYQWKRNGNNVGAGSALFSTSLLQDGDTVSCIITADTNLLCATSDTATSNKVIVRVANVAPTVTISASDNNICRGKTITFTAVAQNAGNTVKYQWKINGVNSGTNNPVYSTTNLVNSDQVICVITADNTTCSALPISSNIITVAVKSVPVISIIADSTIIRAGSQVKLRATITGSIATYNWTPVNLLTDPLTFTPVTKPLSTASTFSLSVTNVQGCTGTAQITIQVAVPLFMPSAFTPNNDGKNELFRIPPGANLTLAEFAVFDRFGNKIFTTKDVSKGWDGKRSGIALTSGVYVYTVSGISEGKAVALKGTVVLIR